MKRFFVRLISKLFYEKGTHLGKRCSGHKCYPNGDICYGCSDCEDTSEKNWLKKTRSLEATSMEDYIKN